MSRSAALSFLLLASAACRNKDPDPNFKQATAIYQQLYATQLDDAYGDPRMDEVVVLLGKVNPRSIDADRAQAMLRTIQHGREDLARERAEREKMAAAAEQSLAAAQVNIDPSKVLAASEPDAGQPLDPFGPGASVADLNKQNGGCLMDNEPFTEQGTGVAGTVYRVAPSDACRGKLPGLSGQIVLVVDGKIYRRAADPRPPPPPPSATATAARPPAAGARPGPPPGGSPPAPAPQAQQPQ
ncbi:MAG: hypothetical protein AUG04_12230 [Deltaproteobacteria bacterium 13_1_20CM_2_69_21]|nr:MAG: hypothetical protein AUG04_12230 [Deltaproteobacteria bacterium 13_1_20CM_2_69_21]HMC34993.1 hypothetical protein [Myxococcales bacterium]